MGDAAESTYDAIVVGARCAGATLAAKLADAGRSVLVLDHRPPPRNVVSTHQVFPNTLVRFAEMGILERIEAAGHTLNPVSYRAIIDGNEISGSFTPIGDFDYSVCVRRPVLDQAILEMATDAGAKTRFGEKVTGLIGAGTDDDPVRGVVLENGDQISAPWVFGADGRASTVAAKLGLEKTNPIAGEFTLLYAYWRGLPRHGILGIDARPDAMLTFSDCENDVTIITIGLAPEQTRGDQRERERSYREAAASFSPFDGDALDGGELISEILVAPETMLRGFFRPSDGPGWALVGDANHFKHPATAQGISDAVEQALYVGEALSVGEHLNGFKTWRDERAAEHYEFSAQFATFPRPGPTDAIFGGIAGDGDATQDFIDVMSRRNRPSDVFTKERMARWFSAAPSA